MKLLPWRRDRATSDVAPEPAPLPGDDLGPGRWRWRRTMGQPKFRVKRGDGTTYTKPSISARKRKRRK